MNHIPRELNMQVINFVFVQHVPANGKIPFGISG